FDPDTDLALTPEEAQRISAALDTLTVLDPAVGSGSFLIGMLGEIILLRHACASALGVEITPAMVADWKEAIIRDTLYGVDIKPEAIEIAQLRLWLALVVDQTIEQARPLPNLDYKLMAGNSLIETIDGEPVLTDSAQALLGGDDTAMTLSSPVGTQIALGMFDSQKERVKLDQMRQQFFSATPEERRRLRAEITTQERKIVYSSLKEKAEALQQKIDMLGKMAGQTGGRLGRADQRKLEDASAKLARITDLQEEMRKPEVALPFFLYRLHFSEVFAAKGGFDIVIANPPYVRQELISDQKPELKASYPAVYAGTADLYVYFFARAFDLLRTNGQLSFITPNKFMRANYGKKLRGYLATEERLHTLIDFGDLPIFDATTYPMITLASNQLPNDNKIQVLEITSLDESENLHQAADRAFRLPQDTLSEEGWQLSVPEVRALMDKLKAAGKPLGEYVRGRMYRGVLTGLNEAFIIDEAKRAELIATDPRCAEVIKPYLRGRDIKRWQVDWAGLYIIALQNSGDATANNAWGKARTENEARHIFQDTYPAIYAHMLTYEARLRPRADQGKWFWELRACAYYPEFEKPKIVYPDIASRPEFTYDTQKAFTANTSYIIPIGEDIYPLGILNSAAVLFFYSNVSSVIRGGYFRFIAQYVEQIPIPDVPDTLRQRIVHGVQQCLDAAQNAPDRLPAFEAELNALVYQAYGLNEDDIAVIEGNLS
ncbi:MAG: TaqI-like C-terminal specificity domain-containing protein, partial [Anaerolineaceae bacterium]